MSMTCANGHPVSHLGPDYPCPKCLAADNAALRARLAEVEGECDEAVERLREELKRGIRLEARVEKLERVRAYINSASHRDGCAKEWGMGNVCTCGLDAALAECEEGK